jgi:hypothetical protein
MCRNNFFSKRILTAIGEWISSHSLGTETDRIAVVQLTQSMSAAWIWNARVLRH